MREPNGIDCKIAAAALRLQAACLSEDGYDDPVERLRVVAHFLDKKFDTEATDEERSIAKRVERIIS
jgi:hypothetical protein